jgi:hypothetical protein
LEGGLSLNSISLHLKQLIIIWNICKYKFQSNYLIMLLKFVQLNNSLMGCCLCILLHDPGFYAYAGIDTYQRPFHWPHNREIFLGLCLWQKKHLTKFKSNIYNENRLKDVIRLHAFFWLYKSLKSCNMACSYPFLFSLMTFEVAALHNLQPVCSLLKVHQDIYKITLSHAYFNPNYF